MKNEDNIDRPQINAQNCVHCKTRDIRIPQNIVDHARRRRRSELRRHAVINSIRERGLWAPGFVPASKPIKASVCFLSGLDSLAVMPGPA